MPALLTRISHRPCAREHRLADGFAGSLVRNVDPDELRRPPAAANRCRHRCDPSAVVAFGDIDIRPRCRPTPRRPPRRSPAPRRSPLRSFRSSRTCGHRLVSCAGMSYVIRRSDSDEESGSHVCVLSASRSTWRPDSSSLSLLRMTWENHSRSGTFRYSYFRRSPRLQHHRHPAPPPSGPLRKSSQPPCSSMIDREHAQPEPRPFAFALGCEERFEHAPNWSAGMPRPLSSISHHHHLFPDRERIGPPVDRDIRRAPSSAEKRGSSTSRPLPSRGRRW